MGVSATCIRTSRDRPSLTLDLICYEVQSSAHYPTDVHPHPPSVCGTHLCVDTLVTGTHINTYQHLLQAVKIFSFKMPYSKDYPNIVNCLIFSLDRTTHSQVTRTLFIYLRLKRKNRNPSIVFDNFNPVCPYRKLESFDMVSYRNTLNAPIFQYKVSSRSSHYSILRISSRPFHSSSSHSRPNKTGPINTTSCSICLYKFHFRCKFSDLS